MTVHLGPYEAFVDRLAAELGGDRDRVIRLALAKLQHDLEVPQDAPDISTEDLRRLVDEALATPSEAVEDLQVIGFQTMRKISN